MNFNEEHLKACSELLKMPVTSFLAEGTYVVQISNGEGHNINCNTNIINESDPKLIESLKNTIEFLGKVIKGSR